MSRRVHTLQQWISIEFNIDRETTDSHDCSNSNVEFGLSVMEKEDTTEGRRTVETKSD